MFGLFKKRDPLDKLRREYAAKMERARDIQRNGDVVAASAVVAEAEAIGEKIDALEAERA